MRHLGRKYYKDKTGGKHKDKVDGVECFWWKDSHTPNKRLEKRNVKNEIEEQLETLGDCLSLEGIKNYNRCDHDTSCQDGVCPTCNYDKYLKWTTAHGHCDQASWDCPDENDCPWKKGLFDFKE